MDSSSTRVLVASCALAGAAAKLASTLATARPAWRVRAMDFLQATTRLGDDVKALRFLSSGPLRRAHVQKIATDTRDALACAMRMHNMLSTSQIAREAAFDGAARAHALLVALEEHETAGAGATDAHSLGGSTL